MPNESRKIIDNAISDNFNTLHDTNLIPILGVELKLDEDRVWKNSFTSHLNERIVKFLESDFKISGSSVTISAFDGFIVTFIDCCKHLTTEEINCIFNKILHFINDNYIVLQNTNDSDSLFGGLKRFLDTALEHINIFIAHIDISCLQNELRNDLLDILKKLNDSYPLIMAIAHLSFAYKTKDTIDALKENKQFIKTCLEKDIISSNHNRMKDAFFAVAGSQKSTKGNFSIQEIVKSAIDHIRYHLDPETYYILLYFPCWIKPNIVMKQNLRILFEILAELPQRIIASRDISAELKADMLYYGGYLAGYISTLEFDDIDKSKCVESWQLFANSCDVPYDIRYGYFRGKE